MTIQQDSIHICGLVVYARPEHTQRVAAALAEQPGLEVHAVDGAGKLVVTLEAQGDAAVLDAIETINGTDGVLTANLVYQHSESAEALREEFDEDHAP